MSMGIIISVIAILVSVGSAAFTIYIYRDEYAREALDSVYKNFSELGQLRLEHWDLAHLFELEENYTELSNQIKVALSPLEESKRYKFLIRERAVAMLIFSMFEQVLYQWMQAKSNKDKKRAKFYYDVLLYFGQRLLMNPRLLYLWAEGGGKCHQLFEKPTHRYYYQLVSCGGTNADHMPSNADSNGPFGVVLQNRGEE